MPQSDWDAVEDRNRVMREALRTYVRCINEGNVEGVIALYADDAVIEDPYGGTRHVVRGIAAIREFYEFVVLKTRLELRTVTGSGANAAAMAVRATVGNDVLDNISVATFDDQNLINRYTTYWGPGDRRPV